MDLPSARSLVTCVPQLLERHLSGQQLTELEGKEGVPGRRHSAVLLLLLPLLPPQSPPQHDITAGHHLPLL